MCIKSPGTNKIMEKIAGVKAQSRCSFRKKTKQEIRKGGEGREYMYCRVVMSKLQKGERKAITLENLICD